MQPEVILRDDGFYEIKLLYPKDKLMELIRDGYGYKENIIYLINEKFAQKFVDTNFDELAKMIDMDTVKLLATRKVAGVVSANMDK